MEVDCETVKEHVGLNFHEHFSSFHAIQGELDKFLIS